jgi:hypothetical protein
MGRMETMPRSIGHSQAAPLVVLGFLRRKGGLQYGKTQV